MGLLAWVLSACQNKPRSVTFEELARMAGSLDGDIVIVDGYLAPQPRASFSGEGELGLMFYSARSEPYLVSGVTLREGTGPGQAQLPQRYRREDLKVYASGGEVLGIKDKVRVTGEVDYNEAYKSFEIIDVKTIERAP